MFGVFALVVWWGALAMAGFHGTKSLSALEMSLANDISSVNSPLCQDYLSVWQKDVNMHKRAEWRRYSQHHVRTLEESLMCTYLTCLRNH